MTAIGGLIQVMMGVTDMEESKRFYADVMGFEVTQDYGKGNARWVNVRFPDAGVTLTLTTFLGDHLRSVEPTDQISDDLYGPGSGVKWFRCADPDGNVLTVAQTK